MNILSRVPVIRSDTNKTNAYDLDTVLLFAIRITKRQQLCAGAKKEPFGMWFLLPRTTLVIQHKLSHTLREPSIIQTRFRGWGKGVILIILQTAFSPQNVFTIDSVGTLSRCLWRCFRRTMTNNREKKIIVHKK